MESAFLTFVLISSFAVFSSHLSTTDWDDVVVAKSGKTITLVCADTTMRGDIDINWKMKSLDADKWKLVLFANQRNEFSGSTSKKSMRMTDRNFQETGNFSLSFLPTMEDFGLYSCLIEQKEKEKVVEKTILLAILTVTTVPTAPIPLHSNLRLIASVKPDIAVSKITWVAPGNIPMKSEKKQQAGMVAKLPKVQTSDNGAYICMVHPRGNSSKPFFAFNVDVTVDADKVASFNNIPSGQLISTATQAHIPFRLQCPSVAGDYVQIHWQLPDNNKQKQVFQYDRWRGSTSSNVQNKKLQLDGPPYNAEAGSFSFVLTPGYKDGGLYICDVVLNDSIFRQKTQLSVLAVQTRKMSSKLELMCLYSQRVQVQSVNWKYQNDSHQLRLFSSKPGHIGIILPLPITADTAGIYTCSLQLKNGQTIQATQAVTLPLKDESKDSVSDTTPSLLPSLSALLLLVPLVAAAVGVLLWRQKHISDRSIDQSLSVHSSDTENIYENPDKVRQASPQESVYMDLKPRGEDDIYKELERYEQCQS